MLARATRAAVRTSKTQFNRPSKHGDGCITHKYGISMSIREFKTSEIAAIPVQLRALRALFFAPLSTNSRLFRAGIALFGYCRTHLQRYKPFRIRKGTATPSTAANTGAQPLQTLKAVVKIFVRCKSQRIARRRHVQGSRARLGLNSLNVEA